MNHSSFFILFFTGTLRGHEGLLLASVEQLIRNTFNGYDCLNFYADPPKEFNEINLAVLIQRAQNLNFTVFILSSLANSNEYCGYVVIACNTKILPLLDDRLVFNQTVRVLLLSPLARTNATFLESEGFRRFCKEKDVVLASLPRSNAESLHLHVKSRYEIQTHPLSGTAVNLSKPFFHSKNERPSNICPKLRKRPVKVATFHCPIYSSIVNGELVDGVETRLYREIERKLNFTSELIIPNDGKRWGTVYPNGSVSGGVMKILHERRADLGFCSMWIEDSKALSMRLSTYWNVMCLAFLVPKPKRLPTRWYNVFTPLPESIWVMVLVGTLITWTACSVLNFFEARLIARELEGDFVASELLILTGILLHAKNPEFNGTRVNRYVYMCWSVFALVVVSQYSTSLISHLTYPNSETMSSTIEELVKNGYYWGTPYELLMSAVFNMDNPWHRKFVNSFVYEKSLQDRLDRLSRGNYSLLVHRIGYRHFMEVYNTPVDILRELRTTRSCNVIYFYLSFVYSKTFPLADLADSIIMRLVESGITKYWLDRVFEPRYPFTTFARVYEVKTPRENVGIAPLGLDHLKGAFLVWFVGILSALLTMAGEIFVCHRLRVLNDEKQMKRLKNILFEKRVDTLRREYRWAKIKLK